MQAVKNIPKVSGPAATFKVAQPTRHLDSLRGHTENPRDEIDPEDPLIIDMSYSIEKHGVIEPLVILPDGTVLCGHRRRVACRVAAKRTGRADLLIVPVVVRDIPSDAVLEVMLHENMQRASLTPLEEARTMYAIMEKKKLTIGDLARLISVPVTTCSCRLAILKLEPEVQRLYGANELPLLAAPHLAHVSNAAKQISMAGMLARRTITLQKLRDMIRDDPHTRELGGKKPDSQNSSQTTVDFRKPAKHASASDTNRQEVITRAAAEANLNKVLHRKISLHAVRSVLEAVCCACGMKGQSEVCVSCPLPRFINGIVGRTEV